ncbi:HAD-IIB family hydrolase [Celeribacter indicus]|uniref:Mannosyl-3-phosphoglycerate phosphatase n=1 Tax=Celeribacter indicus TaxID=1208324 RepID=A0A0B5DND2_9RHOB|nr:HAD-IIB family hydrolase [Celeribacter indicus]AJE45108.1 mannosyl-3-phosphoglycerate phosphatase [Celeribacter indicus]SDX27286.1 mannosyl-3-phosphoglycerate phosphatase [Celeribacter indicus]
MTPDPKTAPRLIVFSDLDGTLLCHDSYSWMQALPALKLMKTLGLPLVLASSKTAAEIAPLRADMGFLDCPAIVENGAGLLPAGQEAPVQGDAHEAILACLDRLPQDLRAPFRGFSDWSVEEVAARTGLALPEARLAVQRQFSEPGLWSGTEKMRLAFEAALAEGGIVARQGGRFLTLSFGATKADRMAEIAAGIAPRAVTMALGDAPNDVEMIEAADFGVIVRNLHGPGIAELPGEAEGRITRTAAQGPEGWNRAVLARISEQYEQRG